MTRRLLFGLAFAAFAPMACNPVTAAKPTLLTANVADPMDLDAFSEFESCVGHAYPLPSSPNSGKNYFWPNSTNFSTNAVLKLFAPCDGTVNQNDDDTNDPREFVQGESVHVWCDGSSTAVRFFHINFTPGILGQHVTAGEMIGYASLLAAGAPPAAIWEQSMNIDISVVEGDDSRAENYFSKLDAAAFAAWAPRGITAISQTIQHGNVSCASYSSNIPGPGIVVLSPVR